MAGDLVYLISSTVFCQFKHLDFSFYVFLASGMSWYLKVTVVLDCGSEKSTGNVVATLPQFGVSSNMMVHCTMSGATQVALPTITVSRDKHGVETWWPRGYGSQPLYYLTVGVHNGCSQKVNGFWHWKHMAMYVTFLGNL
jgi:hypothetical protein